ncbi:MAG: efflux RND transporter periplasmic adaptor subunit [Terriglobia bacterium]
MKKPYLLLRDSRKTGRGIAPLALLGVIALAGCGSREKAAGPAEAAEIPTVAVAKVTHEDLAHDIVLTAEFKPYQEVDVMAKVSGYVKSINVDLGDHVKQGQVLATLEIPEMSDDLNAARASVSRSESQTAQARDEVARAEASRSIAQLSFSRLDKVMKSRPGLLAQQEVDDAQAKATGADAQVSAAKSSLAATEQQVTVSKAQLARAQTLFDYARVTAPFAGTITKRFADTGSMIQAGTASQTQAMPLVRLSQNTLLRLILPVPESAVPTVHPGQDVDVHVPTLKRTFRGRVVRAANKLSVDTRTMDTEVDVANADQLIIPGMYAEVDLTLQHANAVLAVPTTAVDHDDTSTRVMVVTPGGTLEPRTVAVGLETADRVEVKSGLADGDLVVIGSRSGLQAGQRVRPKLTLVSAEK